MTTPNQSPRRLPTAKKIRKHWCDRLWKAKGFDSPEEFLIPGNCFACGMDNESSERAHIVARVRGGDDSLENLHILCKTCHKDSEFMGGDDYMEWLMARNAFDMFASGAIRRGFNISRIFEK